MRKTPIVLTLAAVFATGALVAGPLGILGRDKDKDSSQQNAQPPKSKFQSFQYDKDAEWHRLKKIDVKAADSSQVSTSFAWTSLPAATRKPLENDLSPLAAFMTESFMNAIKSRAGSSWTLTDSPDDETAVLNLSITQISPPQAPGSTAQPSIAFSGYVVDKKTGKTIMSFSEAKPYAISPNGPWYGSSKDIIKTWAEDFAEMSMPSEKSSDEHKKLKRFARMFGMHFAIRKFMD
jgi:hypothetical protein